MIELAPNHKIGLPLANPLLIAAGCAGYGPEYRRLIDLPAFGAIVSNSITLRPQRGTSQPRLVEVKGGLILETGQQNPGVKKVIRRYSKFWRALSIPVIAHLPAVEPDDLLRTVRALAGADTVAAIELGLPADALLADIRHWVRAIQEGCMLPVLAKLPLGATLEMIEATVETRVDALVIGAPPRAAVPVPQREQTISGYLYGSTLYHLALYDVQRIVDLVDLPVIAAGGVHSLAEARAFLSAGAKAVQIDTLVWIDPKQAGEMAEKIDRS